MNGYHEQKAYQRNAQIVKADIGRRKMVFKKGYVDIRKDKHHTKYMDKVLESIKRFDGGN